MLTWTRLGLGAPLPKDVLDGDKRRSELSSNDRLRKQLLGKDMAKLHGRIVGRTPVGSGGHQTLERPRPAPVKRRLEQDDDREEDECGRSSLGKTKRRSVEVMHEGARTDGVNATQSLGDGPISQSPGRRTASNYLDQLLAEKSQRKIKKRKKNKSRLDPEPS